MPTSPFDQSPRLYLPGADRGNFLRLMSFNILTASARSSAHGWERRKELVVEAIRSFQPDLLGLQECRQDAQAAYLQTKLPEYAWLGAPRGGESESALEMAPLLYRREAFELLDAGHFWLSRTPEVSGSLSWGASLPRTLTWTKLKLLQGGGTLLFANTHFDHESARARLESARQVRRFLEQFAGECSLALVGDFNAEKDSAPYRHLTAPAGKKLRLLKDACPDCPGTFHAFGALAPPLTIDWILVSENVEIIEARVTSGVGGFFASDHAALGVVGHL